MRKIPDDVAGRILELDDAGRQRQDIMKETGISLPTIRRVLRENGRQVKTEMGQSEPITTKDIEEMIALYKLGLSSNEIAVRLDRAPRTVVKYLRQRGIMGKQSYKQHKNISPAEFVKVWQTSESITEVVARLDMPITAIRSRAYQYRERGVSLKRFKREKHFDWHLLNELAEFYEEEE